MPYATIRYNNLKVEVRTLDVATHAALQDGPVWREFIDACHEALCATADKHDPTLPKANYGDGW